MSTYFRHFYLLTSTSTPDPAATKVGESKLMKYFDIIDGFIFKPPAFIIQ